MTTTTTSTFKLDTRELDKIVREMDNNKNKVGKMLGFELEAEAKKRAAVDTSAMSNSIYTVTKDYDGYANASGAAKAANPKVETNRIPTPKGKVLANIGPCVNYAGFVEFGTSRMAAQPFMTPAAEVISQKINDGTYWRKLVE